MLKRLLAAAAAPEASFELAAVVTQPPRPTGRGNRKVPQPSPVEVAAAAAGLPAERILAPERPGDAAFLAALRGLSPDLCVTAAYGNYLPSSFLAIPPHGTLNIHPSLLPAYRGAAPVQRSLQDGVAVTGVTLLYTVKAMDAGPILAQRKVPVDPDIQAPQLLEQLFELGADLLVDSLEGVWAGMGQLAAQPQVRGSAARSGAGLPLCRQALVVGACCGRWAWCRIDAVGCRQQVDRLPTALATRNLCPRFASHAHRFSMVSSPRLPQPLALAAHALAWPLPQDEAAATHAAKLQREEAVLDFSQPALVCHNKVRGFAGWPSTFATFRQQAAGSTASGSSGSNAEELVELKLVRTRVAEPAAWQGSSEQEVTATKDGLFIRCTDGSVLQVGGPVFGCTPRLAAHSRVAIAGSLST